MILKEIWREEEFASTCACRKFAKETYGLFGCALELKGGQEAMQLRELYQADNS